MSVAGTIADRKDPAAAPRATVRQEQILSIASGLFAKSHFEATSMRDIAAAAQMTPAALYYHFASKEALFVAVHAESIRRISEAVRTAVRHETDPWARVRAAAVAHLETMLNEEEFSVFLAPLLPQSLDPATLEELVAQRDSYVSLVDELLAPLPLAPGIHRNVFRLHFLSALNGTAFWYHAGAGLTPAELALQLCAMIELPHKSAAHKARANVVTKGEETQPWEYRD